MAEKNKYGGGAWKLNYVSVFLNFHVFQENVDGLTCDHCKSGTFYMAEKNKYGCLECVCMGISDKCTSSDWRLETVG